MINAINPQNVQNTPKKSRTSIFYVNDVHGKMTNMERIYTASRDFDTFEPSEKTDKLKLSSGDIILGEDFKSNVVANKFLNWSGFIANALGNHEMDVVPSKLAELMNTAKYKLLAANVNVVQNSPMKDKIQKSTVFEENGNKYGIIGIAPSDVKDRVKMNESLKEISVDDVDTTIKDVQSEVDKLKAQGINKIILLSHSGLSNDKRIAQETSGIDIILGGHTHDLLKGVEQGKNLFTSKTGEPVVITQSGKDGENTGLLNIEWDDSKGVITKVQNDVTPVRGTFTRTLPMKTAVEQILGKPEIVGTISKAEAAPKNRTIEPSAHANFITDAMRVQLGTDISLLNAANIRGNFSEGTVDTRLMADITPFKNKMVIANVNEVELVNALKNGAKSMATDGHKPGLLLASGLKYDVTKNGEIKNLRFVDKNGQENVIDVNNPNPNKIYKTAMDDFCATGGDNYFAKNDNPTFVEKKFDFDKDKLACDYIKRLKQPVEIKDDGRIKVVD
ncbi:MAG: 5'-nucleotidase C-terminal domain-containing protein [Clostridiaceae bacterium]|jgi:5'-nucleotidase / UDP-sugar diphosphatase|nr:5'-nucleotidase C-terminal domain-containing protein [Clostridiaceae bacterium]